jgi:parvulin-like peptidyl-prolyl isomerase
MVAAFEDAAFSLPIGEYSEPVQTEFGFHIIEVLERRQNPLDAAALEQARRQALEDWLTAQRTATMGDGRPLVEIRENWINDVPDSPTIADMASG